MDLLPPETFDPFVTVAWLLQNHEKLFIRVAVQDLKTKEITITFQTLASQPPDRWIYWAKRVHNDHSTPIRTQAGWAAWERTHIQSDVHGLPADA